LSSEDMKGKILLYIKRGGKKGATVGDLSVKFNANPKSLEPSISELISSKTILKIDGDLISAETFNALRNSLMEQIGSFHKKEPMKAGLLTEEARTKLRISQKVLDAVTGSLARDKSVIIERDLLKLASHKASGGEVKERIEKIYLEAGLTPPTITELLEKLKIKERETLDLLNLLYKEGRLVKVKEFFFSRDSIDNLTARVCEFFKRKADMTPIDFKEMTGLSRKFAIPLLEYLDLQKITIRVGDVRKFRKG
ncbi:MAG: SelB C-terminal domain-containing protein, partial [Deltaproteobacteria bacterium]